MRPRGEPATPRSIDPEALLRLARQRLDAEGADETDYRRAVSDAYYALYHALTLAAVPFMASSADPAEAHRLVRRFRHRHLREAASAVAESADARVRMVARAIVTLQGRREEADYDHSAYFERRHAEELIRRANEAVATVAAPDFPDTFPRALATRA